MNNILIVESNRLSGFMVDGTNLLRLTSILDVFIIVNTEENTFSYRKCRFGDTGNRVFPITHVLEQHKKFLHSIDDFSSDEWFTEFERLIDDTAIDETFLWIFDKDGRPIKEGDTLDFDIDEWGDDNPPEETFHLKDMIGEWPYCGTKRDVELFRKIINR